MLTVRRRHLVLVQIIFINLERFVNRYPITGGGTQELDTEDTDELGHGMRIRMSWTTNGEDHDWQLGGVLTLHRERTVSIP